MISKARTLQLVNVLTYTHCILIIGYVFSRAYTLSLTFDEVTTFQIATGDDWANIGENANNHILNTILLKGALFLFEPSELIFRLPTVLGFIIYVTYALKLGRLILPKHSYVILLLLTTNPFLLDFFSLTRGYGLSLAFTLPCIYFLVKYGQNKALMFGLLSLGTGMLAVLSNFSAMNAFLAVCFSIFLFILFSKKKNWKHLIILFVFVSSFLLLIIPELFELRSNHELYFGGRTSFYHNTILSLSRTFAYHKLNIQFADVIIVILYAIALILSLFRLISAIRLRKFTQHELIPVVFILSIIAPMVQHWIFDTHFPTERTALIYFPILILTLCTEAFQKINKIRIPALKFASLVFLLHFIFTINFNHCYSWKFDAGTKEVYSFLKKNSDAATTPVSMGIDYLFIPSSWYYHSISGLDSLSTEYLVHCAHYDIGLEELDSRNFGNFDPLITELSSEDAASIVSAEKDYYYFHDFMVNELRRHGYSIHVLQHYEYANTTLFQIKNASR